MKHIRLAPGASFAQWRTQARRLLEQRVAPEHVIWELAEQASLFDDAQAQTGEPGDAADASPADAAIRVPRQLPALLDAVIAHRDPQARGLAYRILWRLTRGEGDLLHLSTDDDVARAHALAKAVHRDLHKMKAFVRFQRVETHESGDIFAAWFEPDHFIVERVAPFFVRRFAGMSWSILTPYRSAHWDGGHLRFAPGHDRRPSDGGDPLEAMWRTYYASIFNPARLKVRTMTREMPQRYWKNLPEAQLIPALVQQAAERRSRMIDSAPTQPAKRFAPPLRTPPPTSGDLDVLRQQARDCRRCELWQPATQTVFGQGRTDARWMLVGEQPGDHEDLGGRPFIGPSGRLLDRALHEAGLERDSAYVTNVVKHFRFQPRGKLRLHRRADAGQQAACRPWLAAELAAVRPRIIVCLGSMAASTFLGSGFGLLQSRGQWQALDDGTEVLATVHPSYLLRIGEPSAQQAAYAQWVADLRKVTLRLAQLDAS